MGDINLMGRESDVEFGKHILKVNEYKMVFYQLFAGWREVDTVEEREVFGKVKTKQVTEMVVDYNSRIMNESGANYLYYAIMPLIGQATQSSKLDRWYIYNNWRARLLTCRMTMLSQYFFPKLRCLQCEFVTESSASLREHFRVFAHKRYTKMINIYGLDVDRYPEAAVTLANMSTITYGGLEGFKTRQITEHYVTGNMNTNPMMPGMMPPQGGGWINTLLGRTPTLR